jgi:hypothetical protein
VSTQLQLNNDDDNNRINYEAGNTALHFSVSSKITAVTAPARLHLLVKWRERCNNETADWLNVWMFERLTGLNAMERTK